jgi:mono/diheme cytochrome c family protein
MMRKPIAILLAILLAGPALAQDVSEGENLFLDYCATCHGPSATGNGPMAPAMVLQPTNLTLLQSGNSGAFPTLRVVARIDGRDPLVSHGSPMPVFGDFFEGRGVALKSDAGQPMMTSQPVVDLVAWLKSIQE